MEETKVVNPRPIFQNQPILCPWVTCQPYPSTQVIKNKLHEFMKNHGPTLNNSSSKKSSTNEPITYNTYSPSNQQSSSTHFFYFLRLMQLFPDTHPATLHTVLTLSKNNFFYAIDKLLYAKKCKSSFSKRQPYPYKSTRGRGGYSSTRGKPYNRPIPSYQPLSRTITDDLAEVQRIIGLAEKPYIEVQTLSAEDNGEQINEESNNIVNGAHHQVMNICVENSNQIIQGGQTYVDGENQEVIEIVCFDNDQQIVEQQKMDDSMDLESFAENDTEQDVGIDHLEYDKEADSEPAVIVVDTINDLEESEIVDEGHLIESHAHESNQLDSADFTNNSPLDEETRENDK